MKVVMPIAGRASRFKEVGYNVPKPLIEILGKPMVKWATDSIPFVKPEQMIFLVLKEHVDNHRIDEKLREIYSDEITIIAINEVTEGAACTVLLAKELINNDEPLIISDCDHYFQNRQYSKLVVQLPHNVHGIIPVFEANENKWSFTSVDKNWRVLQVSEKIKISKYANIGAYFFSRGKDFVWAAEEMISENKRINNEFYVCPVYQELINSGKTIIAVACEQVWGLGTPEDVKYFVKNYGKVEG